MKQNDNELRSRLQEASDTSLDERTEETLPRQKRRKDTPKTELGMPPRPQREDLHHGDNGWDVRTRDSRPPAPEGEDWDHEVDHATGEGADGRMSEGAPAFTGPYRPAHMRSGLVLDLVIIFACLLVPFLVAFFAHGPLQVLGILVFLVWVPFGARWVMLRETDRMVGAVEDAYGVAICQVGRYIPLIDRKTTVMFTDGRSGDTEQGVVFFRGRRAWLSSKEHLMRRH
jgi:hypothetical protein